MMRNMDTLLSKIQYMRLVFQVWRCVTSIAMQQGFLTKNSRSIAGPTHDAPKI